MMKRPFVCHLVIGFIAVICAQGAAVASVVVNYTGVSSFGAGTFHDTGTGPAAPTGPVSYTDAITGAFTIDTANLPVNEAPATASDYVARTGTPAFMTDLFQSTGLVPLSGGNGSKGSYLIVDQPQFGNAAHFSIRDFSYNNTTTQQSNGTITVNPSYAVNSIDGFVTATVVIDGVVFPDLTNAIDVTYLSTVISGTLFVDTNDPSGASSVTDITLSQSAGRVNAIGFNGVLFPTSLPTIIPAVPELATWAMMILGLGFSGCAARMARGRALSGAPVRVLA